MSGLIVHAGGRKIEKAELALLPTPEGTKTHKPVPHVKLVEEILSQLDGLGFKPRKEEYAVMGAKEFPSARFFGVIDLKDAQMPTGMGIALGLRNSHDKSMTMGICGGERVFVCDNLAFSGEVVRMRKHT